MVNIYDSSIDPIKEQAERERIALQHAEIEAEVAQWQAERLQAAWDELQAVPSYVEANARQFAEEE
jgi:hypothetical protein